MEMNGFGAALPSIWSGLLAGYKVATSELPYPARASEKCYTVQSGPKREESELMKGSSTHFTPGN